MALIIGNWKMNGLRSGLDEAGKVAEGKREGDRLVICPPSTLLMAMAEALDGTGVEVGAQDCHMSASGAHTGRVSAEMLKDAGATYCIIGHSECRDECGDTDGLLGEKLAAVLRAGLKPVFCVGESLETREAGGAIDHVKRQLEVVEGEAGRAIVAYEPIWAIGTGKTPSADDIAAMHEAMHAVLGDGTELLYGGSVKPANAAEILSLPHVDGALVGGASLKAEDFLGIAHAS
ncbi:triose-phosphate isomerase [Parvularcula maris]|uniref:Triosephosphate isomerase n=1 Tax=Parvularcula maris TaxID=2965077 RepID=A0A9X2RIR3_9PROT|nr:triose-phosphate isomerase [Parvularcula maris]MCQ8185176.1 triose-phosphate isomerase [Parvularcula maris]